MSAEESERRHLPFEPNKKHQKPPKNTIQPQKKQPPLTKEEMAIPQVISQRMLRRVAGFCGIPTVLGISTLIVSYLLAKYTGVRLPPIAVLLVNMGCFGLGVLGITYGVLSASWEEEKPGSWLGAGEFTTNWGRMVEVWRATQQKKV
jgi:hypothetical protein